MTLLMQRLFPQTNDVALMLQNHDMKFNILFHAASQF